MTAKPRNGGRRRGASCRGRGYHPATLPADDHVEDDDDHDDDDGDDEEPEEENEKWWSW